MSTSTSYTITAPDVAKLLSRPAFFARNTPWLFLEDAAAEAVHRWESQQGCGDCSSERLPPHAFMRDTIGKFLKVLARLHELGPEHLATLRQTLVEELGFNPDEFVVYYGTRQDPRLLRF